MQSVLFFSIKMVAFAGLFYLYYQLFLRDQRFHQFNRYYILVACLLALVFPFFSLGGLFSWGLWPDDFLYKSQENVIGITVFPGSESSSGISDFHVGAFLFSVYLLGVTLKFLRLAKSYLWLNKLQGLYTSEKVGDIQFYLTDLPSAPFSFFNRLYWNSAISLESKKGEQIFKHEVYHICHKHSFDILYLELIDVLFWFNPFNTLFRKEASIIHEYLADRAVLEDADPSEYAELLVMETISRKTTHLLIAFFSPNIKRRINMIILKQPKRTGFISRFCAFPIALLFLAVIDFACRPQNSNPEIIAPSDAVVRVPDSLQASFSKAEVEASFPGGFPAWQRFLINSLVYPQAAVDKEAQGTVLMEFVVEKDGSITGLKALNDPGFGLTEEALRVMRLSGNWLPAKQHGKIVRSYRTQPITFRLESE